MVLYADLDSGGWPKTARDRALRVIRKGFAFHVSGDQHLPTLSQYGIDDYRDAGWSFCTPAIYVGYERRFLPERLGLPITGRPEHGHPNTGFYRDPFGSPHYIYAVGNPEDQPVRTPRHQSGEDKSSGYGLVVFDQEARTIEVNAFRYLANISSESRDNQFPGWPHTIGQLDNYGRQIAGYLPTLRVHGIDKPVVILSNELTGEIEYAMRLTGNEFEPFVFEGGTYSIKVGDPDQDEWQVLEHLQTLDDASSERLEVTF